MNLDFLGGERPYINKNTNLTPKSKAKAVLATVPSDSDSSECFVRKLDDFSDQNSNYTSTSVKIMVGSDGEELSARSGFSYLKSENSFKKPMQVRFQKNIVQNENKSLYKQFKEGANKNFKSNSAIPSLTNIKNHIGIAEGRSDDEMDGVEYESGQ